MREILGLRVELFDFLHATMVKDVSWMREFMTLIACMRNEREI
jgi:hypothetical protein